MESGEEAKSVDGEYVDISCIVTSNMASVSLVAGERVK